MNTEQEDWNQRALALLKRLEFRRTDGFRNWCPVCGRTRKERHSEDCELGKLIKEAKL